MKNKLKKTMTALCAALILMGGFSVPAYAQGAATEPPAEDATNDSNVIVEEKEETPPLTPVSYTHLNRTAAVFFAQRKRRDKSCGYGDDCRHAPLLPACHV